MALDISITSTDTGISGNYLKITRAVVDKQALTLSIELSLFTDNSYSDKEPVIKGFKNYRFSSDKTSLAGNIIALGYTLILAANDPALSGATSV